VGEVLDLGDLNVEIHDYLGRHPHVIQREKYKGSNRIYIGKHAGVFLFDESLVLTKEKETRSRWELPGFFADEDFKAGVTREKLINGNVKLTFRGRNEQELLITSTPEVVAWAENLIQANKIQK
jgi:hypothetical protein